MKPVCKLVDCCSTSRWSRPHGNANNIQCSLSVCGEARRSSYYFIIIIIVVIHSMLKSPLHCMHMFDSAILPASFLKRPPAAFVRDAYVARFAAAASNHHCCTATSHWPPVDYRIQSAFAPLPDLFSMRANPATWRDISAIAWAVNQPVVALDWHEAVLPLGCYDRWVLAWPAQGYHGAAYSYELWIYRFISINNTCALTLGQMD